MQSTADPLGGPERVKTTRSLTMEYINDTKRGPSMCSSLQTGDFANARGGDGGYVVPETCNLITSCPPGYQNLTASSDFG